MSSDKNAQQQKTALVTGAAARIGAAIAEALHQRGCLVAIHYNSNRDDAEALAERLNAVRGGSAFAVQADLSQSAGIDQLAQRFRSRCERLDVLVNNASRFYPNVVGETQAWQWEDLLNSNLRGPWFLVQELLGELRAADGSIVNLVDVHAERPMPGHSVYCIAKAGVAMMTRALARELGPEVRVNGVYPARRRSRTFWAAPPSAASASPGTSPRPSPTLPSTRPTSPDKFWLSTAAAL
jgi:pteridine reductase